MYPNHTFLKTNPNSYAPTTWKANAYSTNHVAIVRSGFNYHFVNVAHTDIAWHF